MWDLMEFTPPNTTAQLGHLGEEVRYYSEIGHLQHPLLLLEDKVNFKRKSTKEHEQGRGRKEAQSPREG